MNTMKHAILSCSIAAMATVAAFDGAGAARAAAAPATHRDVQYGPDERNVLDFWVA